MKDRYLPAAVWTFPDVIALFFAGLVGSVIALSVGQFFNGGEQLSGVPLLAASSIGQATTQLGMLAYMSRMRGTASWDLDFGLRFRASDWLGLIYGMFLQVAVILFVQLPIAELLNLEDPPTQDVAEIAGDAASWLSRIAIVVVVVVLAPLTEELLYRGVLLSRLRRGFSRHVAVAISAAVFAGIHLVDPDTAFIVPGLFVIGLVLGYQALHTGRVGLAIMTHAGVNLLAAVAILAGVNV